MASGSLRLFISREELEVFLNRVRVKENLWSIIEDFSAGHVVICPPANEVHLVAPVDRVTLAAAEPGPRDLSHAEMSALPYKKGWISLDTFIRGADILYMSKMSFRSEDVSARKLFNRLKATLVPTLQRGVTIVDVVEGNRREFDGIFYSPGAKRLAEEGITWMQFGVHTQRFLPALL